MRRASKYRESIRIQKKKTADTKRDDHGHVAGGVDTNWHDHCLRRAEIVDLGADEEYDQQQTKTVQVYRVTLREDSETKLINTRMRILWCDKKLNIGTVQHNRQDREMEIECRVKA